MKDIVVSQPALDVLTREIEQLVERGATVTLTLSPLEAYAVLGNLQLACRHPENDGQGAAITEAVGRRIQQAIAPKGSPLEKLIEVAWSTQCQHCGCTSQTPCLDDRGEPCYWAAPSVCSACARPLIFIPGGVAL